MPKRRRSRPAVRGRPPATRKDPPDRVVGERVRAAMRAHGLSEQALARILREKHRVLLTQSGVHRIASGRQLTTRRSILEGIAAACGGWPVTADWLSGHELDWRGAQALDVVRPVPFGGDSDGPLPPRYFLEQLRFAREFRQATERAKLRRIQFGALQSLTSLRARRLADFGVTAQEPREEEESAYAVREVAQLRARLGPVLSGEVAFPESLLDDLEDAARALQQAGDDREYETFSPEAKAALEVIQREQSADT